MYGQLQFVIKLDQDLDATMARWAFMEQQLCVITDTVSAVGSSQVKTKIASNPSTLYPHTEHYLPMAIVETKVSFETHIGRIWLENKCS